MRRTGTGHQVRTRGRAQSGEVTRVIAHFDSKAVLTQAQALAHYKDDLCVRLPDDRKVVLPSVIGTVFFERGSQPYACQGILNCLERFDEMLAGHLKRVKDTDPGRFPDDERG